MEVCGVHSVGMKGAIKMMLLTKREEAVPDPCIHAARTRSGTGAGLERVICSDCGHVSVNYLFDALENRYPMAADILDLAEGMTP